MEDTSNPTTILAGHEGQLERLSAMEVENDDLRALEVDLEVDAISAQTELSKHEAKALGVDARTAAQLLAMRERRKILQEALDNYGKPVNNPTPKWEQAKAELESWLGGSGSAPGAGIQRIRTVMSMLTLAALIAAFTVHLAFLILLIPIGATSAFQWSGDDGSWRRMGCRRAFEATGLRPPLEWNEDNVSLRIAELTHDISEYQHLEAERQSDVELSSMTEEAIALELVDKELAEQSLTGRSGLDWDALNPDQITSLRALAEQYTAQERLADVQRRRRRLGDEAESIRSNIYRYLQKEDALATSGHADTSSLRQGLEKVHARFNS